MKILTKKKQEKIYKLVAVICKLAIHTTEKGKSMRTYEQMIDAMVDISFEVGGIKGITRTTDIVNDAIDTDIKELEKMQELKIYRCEFCGTTYNEKIKCQKCERGHRTPRDMRPIKYLPISVDKTGYPLYIEVDMDNGKTVRYEKRREV